MHGVHKRKHGQLEIFNLVTRFKEKKKKKKHICFYSTPLRPSLIKLKLMGTYTIMPNSVVRSPSNQPDNNSQNYKTSDCHANFLSPGLVLEITKKINTPPNFSGPPGISRPSSGPHRPQ
jgi:hypothetical protein